jgi:hypothetical protein
LLDHQPAEAVPDKDEGAGAGVGLFAAAGSEDPEEGAGVVADGGVGAVVVVCVVAEGEDAGARLDFREEVLWPDDFGGVVAPCPGFEGVAVEAVDEDEAGLRGQFCEEVGERTWSTYSTVGVSCACLSGL